jgi:hypothetical protein
MDISSKDSYGTKTPRGQATTLLDLVSRDDQDGLFFPLMTSITRFYRGELKQTIPFSSVLREFTFLGPAELGQRFTFEINSLDCGDLLQGLFIQVQMPSWFTRLEQQFISSNRYQYTNPSEVWTYINSLGTSLLEEATLEVDDQVLERITGDACAVVSVLFPELNTQVGGASAEGRYSIADIKAWPPTRIFPTEDGWITLPLAFSLMRERLQETFPLLACRDGTIRVRVTLKRFDQIVRIASGARASCTDTPMNKTFRFYDTGIIGRPIRPVTTAQYPPDLRNIQLLTYGVLVDGPYRDSLYHKPFERGYREIQQFDFTEPMKYVLNKTGSDTITIQLPLEANSPVEEILWVLRRKAAITLNNDWTNFSATLEKDYNPTFAPLVPLLSNAKIQANGIDIISKNEEWFRSHISRAHKGGKVSYDAFVYGYSFAARPSEHNPSGTMNASRLSSLRLTLDVKPPGGVDDTEWEVIVFVFGFQWLRFENGICNKVFID